MRCLIIRHSVCTPKACFGIVKWCLPAQASLEIVCTLYIEYVYFLHVTLRYEIPHNVDFLHQSLKESVEQDTQSQAVLGFVGPRKFLHFTI